MKKLHFLKLSNLIIPALLIGAIILVLPSCSKKLVFQKSSVVPGAQGSVSVKKGKNNNYQVDVKIMGLAKPGDLTPPKDVYVVWMNTEGNDVKNIGRISSSSSLLSNTLKGELKATATAKPTSFFITAESSGDVQFPGNQEVLRTK